jgi:hypothetical protein
VTLTRRRVLLVAVPAAALVVAVVVRGWGSSLFGGATGIAEGGELAVADPSRVRFVAIGDQGRSNPTRDRVAAAVRSVCAARGCDFGVMLGDNLYPYGMEAADDPRIDEVMQPWRESVLRWLAVLGNHDYGDSTEETRAEWQLAWARTQDWLTMPAHAWSATAGPVHLYGLDTTAIFWWGGDDQRAWLLDQPLGGDGWDVVLGHHTYVANATHGNAGAYDAWQGAPVASGDGVKDFFDEAVCGRADLYLCGHDHVRGWYQACGTEFVVSGAAATPREIEDRGNVAIWESGGAGFAWIELGERMTVAFYDGDGRVGFERTVVRSGR